jgi:hypothetical protein
VGYWSVNIGWFECLTQLLLTLSICKIFALSDRLEGDLLQTEQLGHSGFISHNNAYWHTSLNQEVSDVETGFTSPPDQQYELSASDHT